MRTNASMIEVNVSSSASAMSPQPYSRTGLFPKKARDSLCPSCRWAAALHRPRLMIRRGRFTPPLAVPSLGACCCAHGGSVLLSVWRQRVEEKSGGVGGGESDAKATNHTSNSKTGFWWWFIHPNAIIFTLIIVVFHEKKYPKPIAAFMCSSFIYVSLTSCRSLS